MEYESVLKTEFGMEFEKGLSKKGKDFSFYDFMDLDPRVLREMWKEFMRDSNGIVPDLCTLTQNHRPLKNSGTLLQAILLECIVLLVS
jgi:hypothetical protein